MDSPVVKSVAKTITILESLARDGEAGVTELASKAGMHKSTAYRFLTTLRDLGYVRQDPDSERYAATLALFELGSAILSRTEIWEHAHPVMEKLAQETHETVHLAVLQDDRLVYLHKIESTHSLRVSMRSRIGQSAPLHCTGVGKVLLAFSGPDVSRRIAERHGLPQFTNTTITDLCRLEDELEEIRRRGFAVDNEERELGVRCVAVPLRHGNTGQLAAISISAPSARLADHDITRLAELLRRATEEI